MRLPNPYWDTLGHRLHFVLINIGLAIQICDIGLYLFIFAWLYIPMYSAEL